ncbi:MAG: hypothetical protein KJZ53_04510 [Anaerolineales bacterium]|nr:hypothetical protein [Anaerolineales bacterium]
MPRTFYMTTALLLAIILSACGQAGDASTPTPEATSTPNAPQVLNICMASEPSSLYIYADSSSSAAAVRQAIYDGPFDLQNYVAEGVIFETWPAPTVQSVTARQGDLIVDAYGRVAALAPGVMVRPAGCQSGDCMQTYTEGEIQLDQVSATFVLQPGLRWSDGTALTANDSVFSFQIASADETPSNKDIIAKTASYTAADERTVTWVGVPGFVDANAATRFWHPLPQHTLAGISPADLLTNEQAARSPLGWGPYAVTQWLPGDRIQLARNTNYAGSPAKFAELNFIFIGSDAATSAAALADGRCDVLLPSAGLQTLDSAGAQGSLVLQDHWLHLVFGVEPRTYDDGFNPYSDRADYFGEVAMRQALAQCIDRGAIANAVNGALAASYLPASSPYANPSAALPGYDAAAANASLDALGWISSEDGLRRSQSFAGALFGQALELRLAVSDDPQELAVAEIIRANLTDCGVAVTIESLPAAELFATGPESPIFGRNFDLALFAWPFGEQPACYLFLSEAVPGPNSSIQRYGWGGWNVSGWQNAEFDAACHTALNTLTSDPAHTQAHQAAHAIFAEQLPALPLAVPYGVVAARPDFCGLEADTQPGARLLQSIATYGYGSLCP